MPIPLIIAILILSFAVVCLASLFPMWISEVGNWKRKEPAPRYVVRNYTQSSMQKESVLRRHIRAHGSPAPIYSKSLAEEPSKPLTPFQASNGTGPTPSPNGPSVRPAKQRHFLN